ncbi:beta-glucoside-specific PTS transporter subunit IIABC [Pantoea phytobeneficialis]|uniref:PTS system glucose-specific EIIA component n=1 Tax=Pantoea phytobeneficialis TaxID=2052056 RepID=A0AAP9HB18_9GAMM|nr:beta-glucoside-specific PTS transporter subunit IIABC [Pantoea phytobeneficialis]MDO6409655.1 beta-glucoside-specific PTS transporter subunit IIABC [Pantoea phytobeneficialis]QGR10050.1 PTS beta-glucoside transporter subunit EIIBCA [Pantoea phytobeneficialis]
MDYQATAKAVIAHVGGAGNIDHIEHCSTRLRLTLRDNTRIDQPALAAIPGVLGVRVNVQCQVIIGKDVVEIYDAVKALAAGQPATGSHSEARWAARCVDFVISVFQPLVPAIAGGGVLKSLLILLDLLGWLPRSSDTYKILDNIGSAPLYFLPILVAITTANKLKVNVLVAVSAVSVMVLPMMSKQLAEGITLFSFDLKNIAYASQVFPAILCVLFYSRAERFFNRYSPSALRIFLSPMLSLLVTVPVTLLILGPLGFELGSGLATVILWLYSKLGFVATALLAGVLPFMVAAGMHKPMIPYVVASMGQFSREMLYLPASLAHNIAEAGACLAIALRSKDKVMKSTALSAGISALCGITEPALYGITLLNKTALYAVMAASVIGGGFLGWMTVEAFALVSPSLASISMFISPTSPWNILYALLGAGLAFAISFVATLFFWREKAAQVTDFNHFVTPAEGRLIPLAEVQDDVFSAGIMGDGIAVIPTSGKLFAPANGVISNVFDSGHAVSLLTTQGAEVILHIGIDTIKLNGKGFHPRVTAGQTIQAGDLLVEFDLDAINTAGFDPVIVMVITNSERFSFTTNAADTPLTLHSPIMTFKESL